VQRCTPVRTFNGWGEVQTELTRSPDYQSYDQAWMGHFRGSRGNGFQLSSEVAVCTEEWYVGVLRGSLPVAGESGSRRSAREASCTGPYECLPNLYRPSFMLMETLAGAVDPEQTSKEQHRFRLFLSNLQLFWQESQPLPAPRQKRRYTSRQRSLFVEQ